RSPGRASGGRLRAWVLAARPKTLAAAVVPVAVGSAVALDAGGFAALPALAALVGALWIQVGTNFANDYFDFVHGADTADRVGPTRAVAAGLLTPAAMRAGAALAFGLATVCGLYLALHAGWPVVVIGVASVAAGVGYTAGGRWSLGYLGLGDLFVFVFFGPVAVAGTAYVQTLRWPVEALWASVPVGCLAVAVLVVNNYRDAPTDRESGKRTLAVRFGRGFARGEYVVLLAAAYAVPLFQWVLGPGAGGGGSWILLPWLCLPLAAPPLKKLFGGVDGAALNTALAETARLLVAFGGLYAVGVVL
ncbi:MAG: 1,4-dihydroxy-2-naphthoate polyprenyltransferase, partial [Thermoanaerobaculia bacterium]